MHRPTLASTLPLLFLMASARLPNPARSVAITIDDLPVVRVSVSSDWASVTDRLLTTLKQYDAPAIGFVNESKLYDNGRLDSTRVALLQDWLNAGEELGNHTFAHTPPDNTPLAEYLDGIQRGEVVTRALAQRSGRPFRYFRHPLLHTGRSLTYRRGVERFLAAHGYTIAPVTVDNQEWVYARAYVVAQQREDTMLVRRGGAGYLPPLASGVASLGRPPRTAVGR